MLPTLSPVAPFAGQPLPTLVCECSCLHRNVSSAFLEWQHSRHVDEGVAEHVQWMRVDARSTRLLVAAYRFRGVPMDLSLQSLVEGLIES